MPPSRGQVIAPDEIFRESSIPALPCKVYDNVEEGDDYDSSEDIYSESSQPSFPSTAGSVFRDALDPGVGRKRSAPVSEYVGALVETKRTKLTSTSTMIPKSSLCPILPQTLWAEIFCFLPPTDLARQRRTCELFQKTLEDESIWRQSRKNYLPDHPRPVFGLTEWEMLCMMWGKGCMLCEDGPNRRVGNTRTTGLKDSATAYWQFRVRCCKGCLVENTTKEFTLLLPTSPTAVLLPALLFGIVDLRNNWISNPTHYQPNIGLTKIFWNADISDVLGRYQEAIDVGAQEEWLSGLEAEGQAHKLDVMEIERFERRRISPRGPRSDDAAEVVRGKELQPRGRQPELPHEDYLRKQVHVQCLDQQQNIGQNESAGGVNNRLFVSQSISSYSKAIHHQVYKNDIMRQRGTFESLGLVECTPQEVAEERAKHRSDIQKRCLQMIPTMEPGLLPHLPAFQDAMEIALPLKEQEWENLKVKLLEQLPDGDEQNHLKRVEWHKLQKHPQERRALDQKQKESKERKGKEWDDFQTPVRQKLGVYADEIINRWMGSITKETAPNFAADVLNHCRRRFYEENPYSADDPYHINPLDTTTRVGKATLEVPTTRRLTLENMKFVFDSRVRPSTDRFGKELFLCSGCEYNPRFYAFEGVIQHYAAKHTSRLSVGPIVVHWKADWPAKPPFNPDPLAAGMVAYMTSTVPNISQTKLDGRKQSCPPFHGTTLNEPPSYYGSTAAGSYSSTLYPGYILPSRHQQMQQEVIQSHAQTHPIYLEQIAKDAREAWFQLSGIKDLPPSVRIHYVISKTIATFQTIFSCEPPLTVFIESLKEYASLKPVKNTNGLLCLECYRNPPPHASDGVNRVGRLFTFSALLQHFQTMHIARNRATLKPDWKTEMVKLPETRTIGMIGQAQGMDEEKYKLLKGVFALAFSLPFPGKSFNGVINRAVHIPTLEDCKDRPTSLKSMTLLEQKGARSNDSIHHGTCAPKVATRGDGCQTSQSLLDHQYSNRPIDTRFSCLEPCTMRNLDDLDEFTNLTAIKPNNCGYPPGPNLRQKPVLADDKHTMNAAERFLENFLRNTSDEQKLESKENEKKAISRSPPRAPGQGFGSSPLQSAGPEYRDRRVECSPRPAIDSRDNPEAGAHFDSSLECSHEVAPVPSNMAQYDHILSGPREIAPIKGSVPRYPLAGLRKYDSRNRSQNRDKNCDRYHRHPSINPMEKYNSYSYPRKDSTYSNHQPLANDPYPMRDTYWSSQPPVVYPVPPLPPVLPTPGCYDSQYGIGYGGRTGSGDLLPQLPDPPAQYSRYLPPRSLVSEAAYRHRSRSPPVITRSSEHIAMSYTSVSAPLPREYGTAEDHRKTNGDAYHQQRRDRREPGNYVWKGRGRGNGRGSGRGGGTRGVKMR